MKGINLFFHSIKQGLANLRKNRMFTLASMGTIAACLFVFGLFYFVLSNFQNILHSAEQSVGISVFFEENLSEKQIADIGKKIEKRDEVERIEYISAAQAWEDFKQENFSKTPELAESFGDDNPLAESASYAIYCKDLERQSTLVKYLKNVKGIRRIKEADEIEEGFSSVNKLVGGVSLVLIVVLLLVSVFLIHSTIATGIAVRKPEIAIMRLMGASDFFIWAPFIVEGVVIGLIGSILPLIVMGAFGLPDHLLVTGIVFLFMIVAVAVYLLIQVCMVRETYDRLLQEGEYTAKAKKIDRKTEKWAAIYWPLVTAVYLGYSLYTFDWGRSWIIWPVAAVFSTVLKAIFGESEEM